MNGSSFRSAFIMTTVLLLCGKASLGIALGQPVTLGNQTSAVWPSGVPATFEDPNLARCVADRGAVPSSTALDCSSYGISSLDGIDVFTALQTLILRSNQISDLAPLSGLTALQSLSLSGNQISDLAPLAGLKALKFVSFWENRISNIAPLAGLTALQELYLSSNLVSDLAPLSSLTSLRILYLHSNQVSDLTPLANLRSLILLFVYSNEITDITPLAGLTAMQFLDLGENQIISLAPLAGLRALEFINLSGTQISDLSPLTGLTKLYDLTLSYNQIRDLSLLPIIVPGGRLGLDLSYNVDIIDVEPLLSQYSIKIDLRGDEQIPCSQLDTLIARVDLTIIPPDDCVGSKPICPAEAALTGHAVADIWLSDLRAMRDEVLLDSNIGRLLIGTYYRHSGEVSERLLTDPRLAMRAMSLLRLLRSDLLDLTVGITPWIDARESAAIRDFATRLMAGASPSLATDLQWLIDADLAALLREIDARPDAIESPRDGFPANVVNPTYSY